MKVIISPNGCGFSLNRAVLAELFEKHPEVFDEPIPASMMRMEGQSDEQLLDWFDTAILQEDQMYFLGGKASLLRTNPLLVDKLESQGSAALVGKHCLLLKVVEIPDDVQWYIREEDNGSESIHEHHRVWA